jgi:hypothetical protein
MPISQASRRSPRQATLCPIAPRVFPKVIPTEQGELVGASCVQAVVLRLKACG